MHGQPPPSKAQSLGALSSGGSGKVTLMARMATGFRAQSEAVIRAARPPGVSVVLSCRVDGTSAWPFFSHSSARGRSSLPQRSNRLHG